MAVMRGLLVSVRERDEPALAPRASEERHAGREPAAAGVAHRHGDRGESGARREYLAVVAGGRVEVADEPRWIAPRRIHERVEVERVHQRGDGDAKPLARCFARLAAGI